MASTYTSCRAERVEVVAQGAVVVLVGAAEREKVSLRGILHLIAPAPQQRPQHGAVGPIIVNHQYAA